MEGKGGGWRVEGGVGKEIDLHATLVTFLSQTKGTLDEGKKEEMNEKGWMERKREGRGHIGSKENEK